MIYQEFAIHLCNINPKFLGLQTLGYQKWFYWCITQSPDLSFGEELFLVWWFKKFVDAFFQTAILFLS